MNGSERDKFIETFPLECLAAILGREVQVTYALLPSREDCSLDVSPSVLTVFKPHVTHEDRLSISIRCAEEVAIERFKEGIGMSFRSNYFGMTMILWEYCDNRMLILTRGRVKPRISEESLKDLGLTLLFRTMDCMIPK